jgi:hypothetical protein
MSSTGLEETVRQWNGEEWITVTVQAAPAPRRPARKQARRPGHEIDLDTLNQASPIPESWRYTAYAPGDQLADTRTHVTEPTVRTHRGPTVSWRKFDDLPSDRSEWTSQDYDVAGTARRVFATITKGK